MGPWRVTNRMIYLVKKKILSPAFYPVYLNLFELAFFLVFSLHNYILPRILTAIYLFVILIMTTLIIITIIIIVVVTISSKQC